MKNNLPTDNPQDAHLGRDHGNALDVKKALAMTANGIQGLRDGLTQCSKYSSKVVNWRGLLVRRVRVRLENANPNVPHFNKTTLLTHLDGYFNDVANGNRIFYGGYDKVVSVAGDPRADEYTVYISE